MPPDGNPPGKGPPVAGYTGAKNADAWPSSADIQTWIDFDPEKGNICLRMPRDVIGIDVDAYEGKLGAQTLAKWEAQWGPLPPTMVTTSRTDGISGIRLFRVTRRASWRGEEGGIELIHHFHRYAIVWPSIHTSGRIYRWIDQRSGQALERPIALEELAELPPAWVEGLGSDTEPIIGVDVDYDDAKQFVLAFPSGDACKWVSRTTGDAVTKLSSDSSRHPAAAAAAMELIRAGHRQHPGVTQALGAIRNLFMDHITRADTGRATPRQAEHEWRSIVLSAIGKVKAAPTPEEELGCRCDSDGVTLTAVPEELEPPTPVQRPPLRVQSAAEAVEWLRDTVGIEGLRGLFRRGSDIVYTPREGQWGYIPPVVGDDHDGPAQVQLMTSSTLASRIDHLYRCYRESKDKKTEEIKKTAVQFPISAARTAVDAPDALPYIRTLRGVIHTPIIREDGSLLNAPGYDAASGLLYLPDPACKIPPVANEPSRSDVRSAIGLLDYMLGDFRFVTDDDRANYIGLLLTPLLRELCPPPYKLGAITAPQPGSGKTLLASLLRILHGGVFRAELPEDDAELRKQVTAILDVTTGSVVQFDNVSGAVRSSTLAGLLTSSRWDDRRLGATEMVSRPNDRLWVITGNNVGLGGDLPRRTLFVTIDPGVPDPHLRTDFEIADLEGWVEEQRGNLLCALLTITRGWIVAGRPAAPRSGDSYSTWLAVVSGILHSAGVPGTFDALTTQHSDAAVEDVEWHRLLLYARQVFGDVDWTARQLLEHVDTIGAGAKPIPVDVLPADLAERAVKSHTGATVCTVSLGKWLANRNGRWAGDLVVRAAGDRRGVKTWRVESIPAIPTPESVEQMF